MKAKDMQCIHTKKKINNRIHAKRVYVDISSFEFSDLSRELTWRKVSIPFETEPCVLCWLVG